MSAVPRELRRINFINTNRCNLRCVYCPQGSHPDEYHADLTPEFFEEIHQFVTTHKLEEAAMGWYGELTMIEGWWKPVRRLQDAGVLMSTTTNGATILSPEEVATFARFKYIEFSIDTFDPALLKSIRKKVDSRTIVHNFQMVKAYCLLHDLPLPQLAWIGVLTFHAADKLPEFIAYAAACGVTSIKFTEVGIYDGAVGRNLNVVDQKDDEVFEQLAVKVDQAIALAGRFHMTIEVAELPRIQARRAAIAKGEKFGLPLFRHSSPIESGYIHNEAAALPLGYTRACRHPWDEFYLDPKGQVFACCTRGDVMGIAKTKTELEAVLSNDKYKKLRDSLESGVDMDPACANCIIKGAVPPSWHQQKPAEPVEAPPVQAAPAIRNSAWNKFKRFWTGAAHH